MFLLEAPLSSIETIMTSSQNNNQVIDMICQYIVNMLAGNHFKNRFVVTYSETTPTHF